MVPMVMILSELFKMDGVWMSFLATEVLVIGCSLYFIGKEKSLPVKKSIPA